MYGPEGAYDPMEVREWKRSAEERSFRDRILRAIQKDPEIRAAIVAVVRDQVKDAAMRKERG